MKKKETYTIKDIAELAEVSRATVDRVIHGRGKVAKDVHDRITKILEDIDFQPNVIAQALRKGDLYRIAVLIPDYEFDIYWKRALMGINEAMEEFAFRGVKIDKFLFNPAKRASFKISTKQLLKGSYNAVLVAPVFYSEALEFFDICKTIDLPYVTFNTHIKESDALCHIGQDLIQSGETAASLFHKILKKKDEILILHIDEDSGNAKHMQEKEDGFVDYFKKQGFDKNKVKVLKVLNTLEVEKPLMKLLNKNGNIKGIFISTSRVHLVADIIAEYKLNIKLIGYDLIDENVQHLKKRNIDFLIYQNPGFMASQGIAVIVDYLTTGKAPKKLKILPIEMIMKENFKHYLQ